MATSTPATSAQRRARAISGIEASFQRAKGPTAIRNKIGVITGTKTASKYGGPTEILPTPSASISSGYSVPSSTVAQATTSSTLLVSSSDSRETKPKRPPRPTFGARAANSASDEPITATRKIRMKMPRRGSVAKACTDVSTPERTRKVPSSDSEKAEIASNTVQFLKLPRFSVTAALCSNAVPTSQGMNEASSTGSQNHQPPQPSS